MIRTPMSTELGQKLVLHVGCGRPRADKLHENFRNPQWREIRLDLDPSTLPDVVGNMTAMPQVDSESVDAVWSSHNLEHLHAHEVPLALKEFWRVLRPGGLLLAKMPDLQKVAEIIAAGRLEEPVYNSPAGPISALDMCFGHGASIARGNHFMVHKTGFSAKSLAGHLATAGFVEVQVQRVRLELWAQAKKAL